MLHVWLIPAMSTECFPAAFRWHYWLFNDPTCTPLAGILHTAKECINMRFARIGEIISLTYYVWAVQDDMSHLVNNISA